MLVHVSTRIVAWESICIIEAIINNFEDDPSVLKETEQAVLKVKGTVIQKPYFFIFLKFRYFLVVSFRVLRLGSRDVTRHKYASTSSQQKWSTLQVVLIARVLYLICPISRELSGRI